MLVDAPTPDSAAGEPEPSPRAEDRAEPVATTPIRSILLPLDGSPLSEQAVPMALAIARASGARVHAVHLYVPFPDDMPVPELFGSIDPPEDGRFEASRAYAALWTERFSREPGVTARCEVMQASRRSSLMRESTPVAEALLDAAENRRADLIVMTTHGAGGLSRAWLGSTADAVIRRARVPVLVIRPPSESPSVPAGLPRHILVPLDGSELGDWILSDAIALARIAGARVTLLTVLVPRRAIARPAPVARVDEADLARQRAAVEPVLERAATRCRERGVAVETAVVVAQRVAGGIIEHAIEGAADLIALTTHGRGGLRRLMLGSVADKVLRGSSVPLLVRRPEFAGRETVGY
jgi:nucleotide-binding universal stress UspA family protein